jgi:hypothetical protein
MEARTILLMRIDVNRDEKLSFDEFLVLFEGGYQEKTPGSPFLTKTN